MTAGSNKDMAIAYVFRSVTQIVLGILVLLGWAIFKLAVEIRDDTRDMKKDWPTMKADVGVLKNDVASLKVAQDDAKKAIAIASEKAQKELGDAEQRVKNEFTRQLNQQIKIKGKYAPDGYR